MCVFPYRPNHDVCIRVAAPLMKKLSLELGGKNAAIVFNDADLDRCVKVEQNNDLFFKFTQLNFFFLTIQTPYSAMLSFIILKDMQSYITVPFLAYTSPGYDLFWSRA